MIPFEIRRINVGEQARRPRASIIIPRLTTYKSGDLDNQIGQIRQQSLTPLEIIVVHNVKPSGRARNIGVENCSGDFIILMDDYTTLGHDQVFENLVRTLQDDPGVGMAGVSKLLPPGSGWFMQRVYHQMPRTGFPVVEKTTESDMATTTCIAMKRSFYLEIGGQNTRLIRGTDPELRYKVRQQGLKVVIAPHTWCYKPQASTLFQFVRTEWRRGLAQGWTYWHFPELMHHAPDSGTDLSPEKADRRSFISQLTRYMAGIPWACIRLKPLLALAKLLWCITLILTISPAFRENISRRSGIATTSVSRVDSADSEIRS